MGAQESSLKPEGDVQRPQSARTGTTETEHPPRPQRLPQPLPGKPHPTSRSTSLGRSASGGNGLNRMDSDPHLHSSGQRRHHTWHNAPKKRVYDQSVWDLQGHNAAYGHRGRANNWESDSESEVSEYSAPRVKRQVSEFGSECDSSDDLPTLARNQDLRPSSLAPSSGGGTWPRPSKRRSDEASGKMNIWELTRALEREKTDLADQLARLTAHSSRDASYQENLSDLGGHSAGHLGHGGGSGSSCDAVLPLNGLPHSLPHVSPIEEESPRSGYSGTSTSLKEAQLARELQLLVQDGMVPPLAQRGKRCLASATVPPLWLVLRAPEWVVRHASGIAAEPLRARWRLAMRPWGHLAALVHPSTTTPGSSPRDSPWSSARAHTEF